MEHKIRLANLFERTAKRHDQMMRELTNKTNRVNEDDCCRASDGTLAQPRVESGEQLVFNWNIRTSKAVKEGRLPSVGVASESDDRRATPPAAMKLTRPFDLGSLLL